MRDGGVACSITFQPFAVEFGMPETSASIYRDSPAMEIAPGVEQNIDPVRDACVHAINEVLRRVSH
jgi:hypothetical protein